MLTCEEATQMASESLDRPLRISERARLAMHVVMCRVCAALRRDLRFIRNALANDGGELLSSPDGTADGLSESARTRIKQAIRRR